MTELKTVTIKLDDFNCPICRDILYLPLTFSCGHSFCARCLANRSNDQGCPACRQKSTSRTNPLLNTLVAQLFSQEWKEREEFWQYQDRINNKKQEYLVSEYYHILTDMIGSLISDKVMISVYKIKRIVQKKLKHSYTYLEILHALYASMSMFNISYIHGPYIFRNTVTTPLSSPNDLTLLDHVLISYFTLYSRKLITEETLFQWLQEKDNYYKYQHLDFYQRYDPNKLLTDIAIEKIDIPFPPHCYDVDNNTNNNNGNSSSDSDSSHHFQSDSDSDSDRY